MLNSKDNYGNIQCTQCGLVYYAKIKFNIEDLYTDTKCPVCGTKKGLYVGETIEDFYEFYNVNEDPRYYNYKQKLFTILNYIIENDKKEYDKNGKGKVT